MPNKAKGRHPEKRLTAVAVRNAKPGRHADGNGLYLVVADTGRRQWVLRTMVRGRRRDIGLGGYPLVGLAEAREQAFALRKIARAGGDPLAQRLADRRIVPTFQEAARAVHGEHKPTWKNEKHAAQWLATLEQHVFPAIGSRQVDAIGTPEVRDVLLPIWLELPETARRVRQRIGTVLDWAAAKGYREGENPVRSVARGLPKQPKTKGHFAALPYEQVPGFVERLRSDGGNEMARLAFEFLILTAARTGEVIGARWSEVDLEAGIWTVPVARMKGGRAHAVPLASRAMAILRRVRELHSGRDEVVFEGRPGKQFSNMAFLMALRRMGVETTAHGFRSSFRDWTAERTDTPRDVAEAALAHAVESRVEAAYRRSDLFEKRKLLMERWARFIEPEAAKVVPLRAAP